MTPHRCSNQRKQVRFRRAPIYTVENDKKQPVAFTRRSKNIDQPIWMRDELTRHDAAKNILDIRQSSICLYDEESSRRCYVSISLKCFQCLTPSDYRH